MAGDLTFYAGFVIPFIVGVSVLFAVILYKYVRWMVRLPHRDKLLVRRGVFSVATLGALWECFTECLLHRRIWRVNPLLGYMHTAFALGWFLLIVVGWAETVAFLGFRFVPLQGHIFFKYFTGGAHHWLVMDILLWYVLSGLALAIFKRFRSRALGMRRTTRLTLGDRVALSSLWFVFPLRLMAENFPGVMAFWWGYSIALGVFFVAMPFSRYMHIFTEVPLIFLRRWGVRSGFRASSFDNFQLEACSRCGLCIDPCQLQRDAGFRGVQSAYFIRDRRYNTLTRAVADNCLLCGRCQARCPVGLELDTLRLNSRATLSGTPSYGRFDYAKSQESRVKSQESGVRSQESRVKSQESRVRSHESANAGGKLGDETIRRLDNEAIRQLDDGLTRHRSCAAQKLRGVNVGSITSRQSDAGGGQASSGECQPSALGGGGLKASAKPEKPAASAAPQLITHDSLLLTHNSLLITPKIGYFAGCMTLLSPKILTSMERIFTAAGDDVWWADRQGGVCCGRPLKISGDVDAAREMMNINTSLFRSAGITTLVTSCPICLRVFREDYRLDGIEVLHHSEYFARLIAEGRLKLRTANTPATGTSAGSSAGLSGAGAAPTFTYHDPCELGRGLGIYDAPREVIRAVLGEGEGETGDEGQDGGDGRGVNRVNADTVIASRLVEPAETRSEALCCGGSLANTAINNSAQVAMARAVGRAFEATGASSVVTSCPLCKKTLTRGTHLGVVDLSELVASHLA